VKERGRLGLLVLLVVWLVVSFTISTEALTSTGHEQVTVKTAQKLGFSGAATEVLARGAMAVDWFDWDVPAAHAQTENGDDGKPTQTEAQAEVACGAYLQSTAASMRDEFSVGHVGAALYILGLGLHTIQDFAAHQGMTNTEHSYLSYDAIPHKNPDTDQNNIDIAQRYTGEFLSSVHKELGEETWNKLLAYQMSSWGDVLPQQFRTWTIGALTLAHYHHMGVTFSTRDQMRWNHPDVKTVKDGLIAKFVCGLSISCDADPAYAPSRLRIVP
jgi:hypothetical protein